MLNPPHKSNGYNKRYEYPKEVIAQIINERLDMLYKHGHPTPSKKVKKTPAPDIN